MDKRAFKKVSTKIEIKTRRLSDHIQGNTTPLQGAWNDF
jgi:hypothetical protein